MTKLKMDIKYKTTTQFADKSDPGPMHSTTEN